MRKIIIFSIGILLILTGCSDKELGRMHLVNWNDRQTYLEPADFNGRDILIKGTNKYLNFSTITKADGYGFRDNSGVMEYKNSGGNWGGIGSGGSMTSLPHTQLYIGNSSNNATATSSLIILDNGDVGVGTISPIYKLDVYGNVRIDGSLTFGTIVSGIWNGTAIDVSDYTNLAVSGTLLDLTGDTLSINEGTLTDTKLCTYESGIGLQCTHTDLNTTYTGGTSLSLDGTVFNVDDDFLKNNGDVGTGDYAFDINTLIIDSINNKVGISTSTPSKDLSVTGQLFIDGSDTATSTIQGNLLYTNNDGSHGCYRVWGATTTVICY